jgi:methionyl aminopeptidase
MVKNLKLSKLNLFLKSNEYNHVCLKTREDIDKIRTSCRLAEETLHYLKTFIQPGVTTLDLDNVAQHFITKKGARSALKGYKGYPASICTSVNEVAAHGVPDANPLKQGDILTIDVTVVADGWHGDAAWTFSVGTPEPETWRLIKAAWQANINGIMYASAGHTTGDIGYAISQAANKYKCTVFKDFVGHGIGQAMHEDPVIPNYGIKGQGLKIIPGMVFTVEPMLSLGRDETRRLGDGWTIITEDASRVAQFEQTVAVFKNTLEILTFSGYNLQKCLDQPPFF